MAWRTVSDETVVLNLVSKRIYCLSRSGALLWDALSAERGLDRLAGGNARSMVVAASQVAELAGAGLVELDGRLPKRGGRRTKVESVFSWSEELARAVGHCAFFAGQNELCNQTPGGS